ncbi:GGDEF domain-containing protein [Herminiimonas arsenitoxidans]|uniref:GGDEF domain-containing protein n=1 Tax=Herminiimonas arsenitoxidans TaxID=1809410 RepID=UPI0009703896|nr:GGDEF domain-containing protein [Herminiimonas arsenitoxidans]
MEQITTFGASGYAIGSLHLFDGITDPVVATLLAPCAVVRILHGQTVSHPHNSEACVYAVLRGALGNTLIDETQGIRTEKILPGESVGELSVLDDAAHSNTLIALQETDLLVIESSTLWRLIDEADGVARNLLRQLSFRLRAANAKLRRREKVGEFYRQLSMVDGLTNLNNRAWLNDKLSVLIEEAHRTNQAFSLIMIDLDYFKQFNDQHGHLAGDNALRTAAGVLSAALRPSDFAVRYGGEELIVILPDSNDVAGTMVAQRLCERMRLAVVFDDMRIPLPHITASFGVASLVPLQDADGLLASADAALYRAKEAGRNQVAV